MSNKPGLWIGKTRRGNAIIGEERSAIQNDPVARYRTEIEFPRLSKKDEEALRDLAKLLNNLARVTANFYCRKLVITLERYCQPSSLHMHG